MVKISFVIPCYKSEETVARVIQEIIEKVNEKKESYSHEIIAVNDCSPDNVWTVLKGLANNNSSIKLLDLAINGGKHAALMAGFNYVTGDIVVGVDDDLQCPIDRLWDLIEPLEKGYDVSIAKYSKKNESLFKQCGSKVNDWMIRVLLNKPKGMVFSNFIARKRFVCDEIIKYQHSFPYLEGLTLRTTRNYCFVPMEERARENGKSGYGLKKSFALWLNGCTAFSVKPLRISSAIGVVTAVFGFGYGLFTIVRKILNPMIMAGYSSLLAVVLIIGGMMMMMIGMLGEYVGRIYLCLNNAPQYVIREMVNLNDE